MFRPDRHRLSLAVLGTALLTVVVAGSASSGAPSRSSASPAPPTVELLSRGSMTAPFDVEARGIELDADRKIDTALAHLTFAPGASTGWHRHPGPTVVTVITGELTVTERDCGTEVFEAGQSFVERGPDRHMATNTGGTVTETHVAFYVPTGAPALTIPAAAPACAN
jgi:quercetin dioxygenase-like cupin family protein